MFYKKFSFQVVFRIAVIILSMAGLVYLLFFTRFYFTSLGVFLLIVLQIVLLIQYIFHLLDDVFRFATALSQGDHSLNYPVEKKAGRLKELYHTFNKAILFQREMALQKEAAFHLFRTILEKVRFGVIVVQGDTLQEANRKTEILFMNEAASFLLDVPIFKYLHWLKERKPDFIQKIIPVEKGGKTFVEFRTNERQIQLSVDVLPVKSPFYSYLIITINNIKDEIEQKETEAWNKLIRVLSHEILNSITPINSLTDTLNQMLVAKMFSDVTEEEFNDMKLAISTIKKRTAGLMDFVADYRKIAELPSPVLKPVQVGCLLVHVKELMQKDLQSRKIDLKIMFPGSQETIKMDEKLIEQVLINLLTNSMYALEKTNDPCIVIRAGKRRDQYRIEVEDNGKGIPEENTGKIFIPFFTTRENGSGLGLTICRNIMKMHKGALDVYSVPGKNTIFTLVFPG